MKQTFFAIATAFLAAGASSAHGARVSVDFFYDALEPHGEWVEAADYGYVWHPRDVGNDWRPYTDGNWAYTDAGWTWVSEEPFGWATYHYGRWVEIERTGWVWVPDTTWGPAWVSWRRSKTHVGWAPLPPEARFESRVGFRGWVDSYYDIGPTHYSFVNVREFGSPRLRTVVLPARENITIINQTTNITNITYANNVVINNGPEYDVIVRESAQPVRRLKLERRTDIDVNVRTAKFNSEVTGQSLRVVAPEIEAASATAAVKPKKVGQKLDRVAVNRGWRDAGDPQRVKEVRAKMATETKAPEGLPPKPQLRGSDTAASSPDAARPAAGTAATESETNTPRGAESGTKPPADPKKPGAVAQQPTDQPGATPTEPETKPPGKAGQKPDARKPGATAQQPDSTLEDPTVRQPDAKRPGATAQEKRDPRRDERPGAAKKKAGEDETAPTAEAPTSPSDRERPQADRPNRERPEVREEAQPDATRSQTETDRPQARPEKAPRSRATDEATPSRPGAERPDRNDRPGAGGPERSRPESERPDSPRPEAGRAERPSPQAERPDRPERRAPADLPQRSPERARPEAADRSPESRPPAAKKPDRAPAPAGTEKDDEKKKDKKEQPELL